MSDRSRRGATSTFTPNTMPNQSQANVTRTELQQGSTPLPTQQFVPPVNPQVSTSMQRNQENSVQSFGERTTEVEKIFQFGIDKFKDVENKNKNLARNLDSAIKSNRDLQAEKHWLSQELEKAKFEISSLQATIEKVRQENVTMKLMNATLKADVDHKTKELEKSSADLVVAHRSNNSLESTINELKYTVSSKSDENGRLLVELKRLKAQMKVKAMKQDIESNELETAQKRVMILSKENKRLTGLLKTVVKESREHKTLFKKSVTNKLKNEFGDQDMESGPTSNEDEGINSENSTRNSPPQDDETPQYDGTDELHIAE